MPLIRPGGTALTKRAIDFISTTYELPEGFKLLDIGCGDGTAAAFVKETYGADVTGIDKCEASVEQAKALGIRALKGDSVMLDFTSKSFDVVMLECVFSVLDRQEESLHEAYCVLKNGGFLIINDVYNRKPDPERFEREYKEAMRLFRRPRNEGDCESADKLPSPYNQDGAIVLDGLEKLINELDLEILLAEDHTDELKYFAGQAIFEYGSLDEYFKKNGCENGCSLKCKQPGYFMLIARKK